MSEEVNISGKRNNHKQPVALRSNLSRNPKAYKSSSTRLHKQSPATRKLNSPTLTSAGSNFENIPTEINDGTHFVDSDKTAASVHSGVNGHKNQRSKINLSFINQKPLGTTAFSSHKFRAVNTGAKKQPVIFLERDNDDDDNDTNDDDYGTDYEDFDGEDETSFAKTASKKDTDSERLNVGLNPVEPTPPKLSDETVISVSNAVDMASAFKGEQDRNAFVGDDDLIESAVNISKNLGEMSQKVYGWNTGARRSTGNIFGNKQSVLPTKKPGTTVVTSIYQEDDPREFEKVFREYSNSRSMYNPVCSSLKRILFNRRRKSERQMSENSDASVNSQTPLPFFVAPKKAHALSATTTNSIHGFNDRNRVVSGEYYSTSPQYNKLEPSLNNDALYELWNGGWKDNSLRMDYRKKTSVDSSYLDKASPKPNESLPHKTHSHSLFPKQPPLTRDGIKLL